MVDIKIKVDGSFPRVGSIKVPLPCPKCKVQNTVSLEQVRREETIQCVGCGTEIKLSDKDKSVQKSTENIQKSFDDLERALKRLSSV
jgi:Zn ribbon nucleic-acid-binding protein